MCKKIILNQIVKLIVFLMLMLLLGVLGFLSNFSRAELSQTPITCNSVTATGMAFNFNQSAQAQSFSYVSSFESNNWSGHLKAYSVSASGVVSTTPSWDAATVLPAWDKRNIVTLNGSNAAVNFDWANLSEAQKTALGSEDVLRYLKGYSGQEVGQTSGIYRTRTNKLGDIVHSSPVYVQKSNFAYQAIPIAQGGGTLYRTFMKTKESRSPMVYVGANDGMLHGFDAATGVEQFAFIPNAVYSNLKKLSDPNYVHQYFVDGQLSEGDAYFSNGNSNGWKTVLLGSTGAGAKSVFALDVTTPTGINVLWEKSATSDDDLGYVLGKGAVVRLRNGEWAAIYGNGVESVNKKSMLYLVNVFTGNLIAKIDTGSGSSSSSSSGSTDEPNGLSTPALIFNNERELIAAYAGDMQGRLWKFDLSDTDKTKWKVAYGGSPLFIAKDSNAQVQPILQKPAIAYHPKGGYLILFGTGVSEEFALSISNSNTSINSIYGIWDKPSANPITTSSTTALQEQTLTPAQGGASLSNATVDWVNQRGWFIDLKLSSGERAVGEPVVTDDILWLLTSDAASANCSNGSQSRLMGVDYLTGGAVKTPVFELSSYSVMNMHGAIAGISNMLTIASATSSQSGMPISISNKTKKIIALHSDGSTETQTLKIKPKPPLRVWHQLFVS